MSDAAYGVASTSLVLDFGFAASLMAQILSRSKWDTTDKEEMSCAQCVAEALATPLICQVCLKSATCLVHSIGNGSSTRANVTSGPCFPSRIASTISGASSVRRRTRVM